MNWLVGYKSRWAEALCEQSMHIACEPLSGLRRCSMYAPHRKVCSLFPLFRIARPHTFLRPPSLPLGSNKKCHLSMIYLFEQEGFICMCIQGSAVAELPHILRI